MFCNPISLFYKENQPCVIRTGSVIRTLYIIGYGNITRGLLNWNICIQIEFATPWLRRWLNCFNNWLYLNIKRTADNLIFFSHTLCSHHSFCLHKHESLLEGVTCGVFCSVSLLLWRLYGGKYAFIKHLKILHLCVSPKAVMENRIKIAFFSMACWVEAQPVRRVIWLWSF